MSVGKNSLNANEGTSEQRGLYAHVFRLSIGKFFMVTNVTPIVFRESNLLVGPQ